MLNMKRNPKILLFSTYKVISESKNAPKRLAPKRHRTQLILDIVALGILTPGYDKNIPSSNLKNIKNSNISVLHYFKCTF